MDLQSLIAEFDVVARATKWALAIAPTVARLVAISIAGLILSRAAARATTWACGRVDLERRLVDVGGGKLLDVTGTRGELHELLSRVTWYLGLTCTVYLTSQLMGWTGVAALFASALAFVPRLIASATIMAGGFIGGEVASRLTTASLSKRPDFEEPELVGKAVGIAVVVVTSSVALEQLGFEVALVRSLIALAFASLGVAAALTFALGGSGILAQLIAGYYARRTFSTGDHVELDGVRGRLLYFGPSGVILEDGLARAFVPYRALTESPVRRVSATATRHDEE